MIMLRKRSLIETVNDQLKNICQIEHTRHRCFPNFIINLLSALAAFSFFDKKPSINTAEEFMHPSFLTVAYIELTLRVRSMQSWDFSAFFAWTENRWFNR